MSLFCFDICNHLEVCAVLLLPLHRSVKRIISCGYWSMCTPNVCLPPGCQVRMPPRATTRHLGLTPGDRLELPEALLPRSRNMGAALWFRLAPSE